MKNIIKIALLFTFITTNGIAMQTIAIPFVGFATYEDKGKKSDFQTGVYANFKEDKNTFEVAYELKNTKYLTTVNSATQNDFTFLYTYDAANSLNIRGAIHYILSSLKKDNNTLVMLFGLEKINNKFTLGINISNSIYNDDALTNFVHQINPYFGFYFGEKNSLMGKFYTKISYDVIYPNSTNQTLSDSYNSLTISFTQNKGNMENTLRYWVGEQLYSVRNNGLTIYNLDDIHSGGFLISTKYKFTKKIAGKFSYISENFTTFSASTESSMNRFLISANFNF